MKYFGAQIRQSKWAWEDKKQRLAEKLDNLRNLEQNPSMCNGDMMDIDEPMHSVGVETVERTLVPLSDEWFADLDASFNNIDKLLKELQHHGTQSSPSDDYQILGADQLLLCMQQDFTACLVKLHAEEQQIEDNASESESSSTQSEGSCDTTLTSEEERERDSDEESTKIGSFCSWTPLELDHSGSPRAPTKPKISNAQLSLGEHVMKQLFRWWRPYGPDYIRDMRRLGDDRMTEVDGLIQ